MKKRLRAIVIALTALILALSMAACADRPEGGGETPPPTSDYTMSITAVGSTTINVSKTVTLRTTVVGTNQKDVTWSSLNEDIATVSDRGVVTGVAAGEATIKATLKIDENCTATIKIKVEPSVAPETLAITGADATNTGWTGETCKLDVAVTPAEANTSVTWTSSAPDIAAVADDGTVTFKAKGNATITATSQADNTKTASVSFTVREGAFITTLGSSSWDYEKQDAETDPFIQITGDTADASKGFNAAYFAGFKGSRFYTEAVFTDWDNTENTWDWQGFGLGAGLSDSNMRFFTYSHHSPVMTANNFNKVIVRDEPNSWGALTNRSQIWGGDILNAIQIGEAVKIGMLRDGNEYLYFLNDVLFYCDYTTKYQSVDTYPTVVTYDMPVKVSAFKLVTDSDEIDAILASDKCSKSFSPENNKVDYVSDAEFAFNSVTYSKDNRLRSIGDRAMVMKNFSIEFDMENLAIGGGAQRFKGATVNFSRYDTADIVETVGIGTSNANPDNGDAVLGRFFSWKWPDGMEGSALKTWNETSEPVITDAAAKHHVQITRTVDEDANKSVFRLFVDGVEYALDFGKDGAESAEIDYIGSYLIWIAGEYTTFKVTEFEIDSDIDAADIPASFTLTADKTEIEVNDTLALACTESGVTYTSLNTDIATVAADGTVTAKAPGKATVTASKTVNGMTVKATFTVTVKALPTVTVTNTKTELWAGETMQIEYTLSSESAHEFAFESSDTSIATVSATGVVTPVADGKVTITVKDSVNPAVFGTVEIDVYTTLRVEITNSSVYVETGTTLQITHRFSFGNNTVTYSVNNDKATISADGVLTPVAEGDVIVTVTCVEDTTVTTNKTFHIVAPLSIAITNTETEMWTTGTLQLAAAFSYPCEHTVTWSSSDTTKATVNDTGLVTAVGLGEVTITATSEARNISDTITLNINDLVIDTTTAYGVWDFTDLPKEDASISVNAFNVHGSNGEYPATVAFKNVKGQKYYAEATFNCTNVNTGDTWNGFSMGNYNPAAAAGQVNFRGLVLSYGQQPNKKLIVMESPNGWGDTTNRSQMWNDSFIGSIDFANAKFAVLRNGNSYYYFANDKLVWYEDVDTRFAGIDTVPGITVRFMEVTVSSMYATADEAVINEKLASAEANRKYFALYPNNVAIDETAGTIEFKNNNDQWPFDNIKDNSAISIGDKAKIEKGKDSTITFDIEFKSISEKSLVGMYLKCWNNPTQARSFLVKQNQFGMTGWDINSNQGDTIVVLPGENFAFSENLAINTKYTVKVERTSAGWKMTFGEFFATWQWDETYATSDYFMCFGAQNCNAVISNISVTYPTAA